jgi:RNA polymerase sigma-70 factor (ECF subfamily)
VLILREVLHWKQRRSATLLDTTVASVNSALQRARATLGSRNLDATAPEAPLEDDQQPCSIATSALRALRHGRLTSLLREDAEWSMPPYGPLAPDPRGHREVVPGTGDRLRGLPV